MAMTAMMRATRAGQRATEWAVVNRPHAAAIGAAEQVAWQRLHAVAAVVGSGTATYRGTLHAWRTARYVLDRALVPGPPWGALRRRRVAHHSANSTRPEHHRRSPQCPA